MHCRYVSFQFFWKHFSVFFYGVFPIPPKMWFVLNISIFFICSLIHTTIQRKKIFIIHRIESYSNSWFQAQHQNSKYFSKYGKWYILIDIHFHQNAYQNSITHRLHHEICISKMKPPNLTYKFTQQFHIAIWCNTTVPWQNTLQFHHIDYTHSHISVPK